MLIGRSNPSNLQVCLLVDGSIPVHKLMRVLNDEVDPLILSRAGQDRIEVPADWKRPFLETASSQGPKIDRERQEVVEFMDKDESMGEMYLAWRGNSTGDHLQEMVSCIRSQGISFSNES